MTEIRCMKCNRLLLKATSKNLGEDTRLEIKCSKCGYLNRMFLCKPIRANLEHFGKLCEEKNFMGERWKIALVI